jgi:DNA (cytosine-5)-methyltransferase 1
MTYRLLDTYCCAGGATRGYQYAGFHVTGVDIEPQPNYGGDTFVQGDAVEFIKEHGHEFDAIAGSPPCQAHSPLNAYNKKTYPQLIGTTRQAMIASGKPYVIENVEAARSELLDPVLLCGPMFELRMYRHRLFEAGNGFTFTAPAHPTHEALCVRNGYLPTPGRPFMSIHGGKHSRAWLEAAKDAMGMPWVSTIREVCEAIPPAYTRHIGEALLAHLDAEAVDVA